MSTRRNVLKIVTVSLYLLLIGNLSGCSSIGSMPHVMGTQTNLSRNNFKVIKSGVQGRDSGFSLLGFLPIASPSYADAMADLHSKIDMEGKATALANVTQDRSNLYLILFSIPRLTITADIVEFMPEK